LMGHAVISSNKRAQSFPLTEWHLAAIFRAPKL
jgi:hypothetical protein